MSESSKLPINTQWLIVTVKEPVLFQQTTDETWLLNPNRRYIINANRLGALESLIETVSELDNAALLRRLTVKADLGGARILVERNRERGVGDLLFLTGPLAYLNHLAGGDISIDVMAYADRGVVLAHSPLISNQCVKCGPLEYDHLRMYNYHWLINTVTEQDSEGDQLNVYDALYRQLGCEPAEIDPKWKRPSAVLSADDFKNLDRLYHTIWTATNLDLRRTGYYVVAPFSNATIRCLNYGIWLNIIQALAQYKPVVVVGNSMWRLPSMDMDAGEFNALLSKFGRGIINAIDSTTLRVLMALISRSNAVVCLDSGPLYIAQALNTPAISLWGSIAPHTRIGYDKNYMDLAVWKPDACKFAPCFAYKSFPKTKCPYGELQMCCSVLESITVNDVLEKLSKIEEKSKLTSILNLK
jgi:hypothetical protein